MANMRNGAKEKTWSYVRTCVRKKLSSDEGAIIVEATLSLPFFIFAIFLVLSITNICYVQAKIGGALASASKEISQYSYLYYALNGDGAQRAIADKGEGVNQMLANINTLSDTSLYQTSNASIGELWDDFQNKRIAYDDLVSQLEGYSKNPTDLIVGIFSTEINDGLDSAKNAFGEFMATAFMRKNLVETSDGDPNRFLRHMNVVDGLNGLNCQAQLFPGGEGRAVNITVAYKIQVLELLGIDFSFSFEQSAQTEAWGLGAMGGK
ncbi:MAG: hypothetical protein LBG97_08950 [Coriobacteriales bacterium]|jgi:hypothetical protein|nr:hypothetical protein [Coriobacteriales bacterium]